MPLFSMAKISVKKYFKILIVDDEIMNIFGLKMVLKVLGVD